MENLSDSKIKKKDKELWYLLKNVIFRESFPVKWAVNELLNGEKSEMGKRRKFVIGLPRSRF